MVNAQVTPHAVSAERAIRLIQVAMTADAAFKILSAYARRTADFAHVGFALQASDGSTPRLLLSTIGETHLTGYVERRRTIDPLSRRVLRTSAPFTYDLADYANESHPMIDYLLAQGLGAGVVAPLRLHTGHTGAVYFMRAGTRAELLEVMMARPTHLLYVTHHFADRVAQLMAPPPMLSREERQCLVLLASGFEFDVISERTGLTERRVKYVIDQLRRRLGATNRPHLIHIAHTRGLLQ